MGSPDQFAKRIFSIETPLITAGAVVWEGPKEIGLTEVRLDGLLSVRAPERVVDLPPPWNDAARHADVVVEMKMAGDHLHALAIRRAELRRAAWHVRRTEKEGRNWEGSVGLWLVASHVPAVLRRVGPLHEKAPGCYAMGHPASASWWIAANELPLHESLIPLLVARSGAALDELARWAAGRREPEWMDDMLRCLQMSSIALELFEKYGVPDELVEQNKMLTRAFFKAHPAVQAEFTEEARHSEARRMLLRLLARRGFVLTDEQVDRIDECQDVATLERWHDQGVTAASADEALA